MKKPLVPPTLLSVANSIAIRIIANKASATVIKEDKTQAGLATSIVAINYKTNELIIKLSSNTLYYEPDWYANYE